MAATAPITEPTPLSYDRIASPPISPGVVAAVTFADQGGFDPGSDVESVVSSKGKRDATFASLHSLPPTSWSDQMEEEENEDYYGKRAADTAVGDVTFDGIISHLKEVELQPLARESTDSVARITHTFDNFTRGIEGILGTDAVLMDRSCAYLRGSAYEHVHTRMFEAVGHYVPNLVLRGQDEIEALNPNWIKISTRPGIVTLVDISHPVRKGYVKYRLVNGKFAQLRVGKMAAPHFAIFPPMEELLGFHTYGILVGLTPEDLANVPRGKLLTPSELFDRAVDTAGSVEQVKLIPYFTVPPEDMKGSKHFASWLQASKKPDPEITLPPAASYREALLLTMDSLMQGSLEGEIGTLIKLLSGLISPEMSEESAQAVYLQCMSYLPGHGQPKKEEEEAPGNTGMFVHVPAATEIQDWLPSTIPYTVNGEELVVDAEVSTSIDMSLAYPAFLAPDSVTPSAAAVLSRQVPLWGKIRVGAARFQASFPWHALSVTPRKLDPKRGAMVDGATWFERMNADVSYYGPYFLPTDGNDDTARWCEIFNTIWMEELLSRGRLRRSVEIWRWAASDDPESPWNVPMHARGLGTVDNRLCLSPLLLIRDQWRETNALDCRVRFPSNILELLISSKVFSVKNAQDYLNGQSPLLISASIGGESHDRYFSDELTFNENAKTAALAFGTEDESMTDAGSGGAELTETPQRHARRSLSSREVLPLHLTPQRLPSAKITPTMGWAARKGKDPVLPPLGSKTVETQNDEWGIPDDQSSPGWRAKVPSSKVPFDQVEVYASAIVVNSVGNWNSIGRQLMRSGVSATVVKHHYSVHWQAANGGPVHEVVQYHNPKWVTSLIGQPVIRDRWHWPTSALAPHPWLSTNDEGQEALYGTDAARHKKKQQQSQVSASRGFGNIRGTRGGGRGRGYGFDQNQRRNWPEPSKSFGAPQLPMSDWGGPGVATGTSQFMTHNQADTKPTNLDSW